MPLAPSGVGGSLKVSFLSPLKLFRTLARKAAGSFLLVVLTSCGGGSSNDSSGTTATQLQGFYQGTVGGNEFISLVLPASGGIARWYGWYFAGADVNNGFLYFGNIQLGVNGAAQSVASSVSYYKSGNLSSQSVTFQQASLSGFNATITDSLSPNYSLSATSQSTLQDSLENTTWTGNWSNGTDVTNVAVHDFHSAGTLTSTISFLPCDNANNSLVLTTEPGTNYYKAELTIYSSTGCTWAVAPIPSQKLTGIGFIHLVAGVKRFEIMLLDTNGKGVSYRGDEI